MVRGALIALALGLAAGPAAATQDAWPALHDVTGVASNDTLNVRADPSADAQIVGALPHDTRGVEVIRPDDQQGWGLVNLGEGTGWVSLRFLARRPGQWQGAFPPLAACFGTEPFWTLRLDGDAVTFATPEDEAAGTVTARLGSSARRDRHGLRARIGERPLSSIVAARACSDGMSDRAYGLAFDALLGDEVLSGCCTLAR
ncbi:MAG: peptide-binding protein [Pseudomonadota bacterium]